MSVLESGLKLLIKMNVSAVALNKFNLEEVKNITLKPGRESSALTIFNSGVKIIENEYLDDNQIGVDPGDGSGFKVFLIKKESS